MTKIKDNETQSKRIKSHDYASWDQFDVVRYKEINLKKRDYFIIYFTKIINFV